MKTIRNITRFIALATFMAVALTGISQTTSQRINDIKRGGKCIFAEATAPTRAEAESQARQLLSYYINTYISENSLSHPQVSADAIPGINFMEMTRGSNIRVFAYVNRDVITGEKQSVAEAPAPAPEPAPVQTPVEPVREEPAPAPAPVVESPAQPAQSEAQYNVMETEIAKANLSAEDANKVRNLVDLGTAPNIQAALKLLGRLQAEYIVKRYGPYNNCRSKTWSFWLIYGDNGQSLEAFLAPGPDGSRYNYISGQEDDSLQRYLGGQDKLAVWFELR